MKKTVLNNGLTVITEELRYTPVVSTVISYRAGSRNESEDEKGLSHFCEHMMFKGTADMPKSRFWQIIQKNGGIANAFTTRDMTAYFSILPASGIEDALRIEADRMVNCLFEQKEVDSEKKVIFEERQLTSIDSPVGALNEALQLNAFINHPYRYPISGFDDDILSITREKALAYYRKYYVPANACLIIVGDFSTDRLMNSVISKFGDIPSGDPSTNIGTSEPDQVDLRAVCINHPSNLARLSLAFHIPSGEHPDSPALDLISLLLAGGRSSIFEASLVQNRLAMDISCGNDNSIEDGLFTIHLVAYPGENIEPTKTAALNEIRNIAENRISNESLEKLKKKFISLRLLSDSSPIGRALDMSINTCLFSDPCFSNLIISRIQRITPEDLSRVTGQYLRDDRITEACLIPGNEMVHHTPLTDDKQQEIPADVTPPEAIDYRGLFIPDEMLREPSTSIAAGVVEKILHNGVRLVFKEDSSFPVVSVAVGIPAGSFREPSDLSGLAATVTESMLYGTENCGYTEFHRILEDRGVSLGLTAQGEYASSSLTLLRDDFSTGLETIFEMLTIPAFRNRDIEHVIEEEKAEIKQKNDSIFGKAAENLDLMMAASEEKARIPTEESLGRISRDYIINFHRMCCRPSGTVITVVGNVSESFVKDEFERIFGNWQNPACSLPESTEPGITAEKRGLTVFHMPGRSQTAILVGSEAPSRNDKDRFAFSILNLILGGGIGSRLGHNVRDDMGLAYAVGSGYLPGKEAGRLVTYLSTTTDNVSTALTAVLSELEKTVSEKVEEIELKLAKSYYTGRHILATMEYETQAVYFLDKCMKNKPLDDDLEILHDVLCLNADQIRRVASRFFSAGKWFISAAGGISRNFNFPNRG